MKAYLFRSLSSVCFFWLAAILMMSAVRAGAQTSTTTIQVNGSVLQPTVKRLGVNLGDQGYWDSAQIMKNLIFENPGFEGLKYRVIFHCTAVTVNSCQDDNQLNAQPAGFWAGGNFRVISGAAAGTTGTVVSNTAAKACKSCGPVLTFDRSVALADGDYFSAETYIPGSGEQGWKTNVGGGGVLTTETSDLSPNTPGRQAMLMSASSKNQYAKLVEDFDTWSNLSFIQMNGAFQVTFRAKGMGGNNQLTVSLQRLVGSNPPYLNKILTLTNGWQDYTLTFTASETGSYVGPVQFYLGVAGGSAEVDDVSVMQTNSDPTNTSVFRDDVVNALKMLNPGTIRMMASGAALGSDLPNQLQTTFARYREGFNADGTSVPNVSYGIHEFLELCRVVGAEPWITIPTATTPQEMTAFTQYLTGNGGDQWSALRISRGQSQPWASVFSKIHIELGNEVWNGAFKGETMNYPAYPQWANEVFGAARQVPGFTASKFDLILSALGDSPGFNQIMLSYSTQHDSFDIAPYLLYSANNEPQSTMFGALFAEPEVFNTPGGEVYQNAVVAQSVPSASGKPTMVSVYETNLGTMIGNITQAQLDALAPSIGGGIAHADNMLQMMRAGVTYQNAFSLPQYAYRRSDQKLVRLWGLVVDMGTTNRKRPEFLTQMMANSAVGGAMLQTTQLGGNPTWNQPLSSDGVQLSGAHYLQSFAFLNGQTSSLVLFNLSQSTALPVNFSGENAPVGSVQMTQLTSSVITDNNEFADNVEPVTKTLSGFNPNGSMSLPPFSMTVLTWSSNFAQAPLFSVASGTYSATQTVSLSSITPGVRMFYTSDGSTPTTASAQYSQPITVATSQTINAISVSSTLSTSPVSSAKYVIQPVAQSPVFSIQAGTYSTGLSVGISDAVPGAKIYYTTDGSTPTTNSAVYSAPITVNASETLTAVAAAANYTISAPSSAAYVIAPPTRVPDINVPGGTYSKTQYVQLSDTQKGATVHCTIDGTIPDINSMICQSGLTISSTTTVNAAAFAPGYSSSPVLSTVYVIAPYAPEPVFGVAGGVYNTPQAVTITDAAPGAKIYYTTDQSTPSTSSTLYTGPVSVNGVTTLQAIAVAAGYTQSFAAAANYQMTVATPTFFVSNGQLGIADVTPGTAIFYTTDGSNPSPTTTQYSGPFSISANQLVKAIGLTRDYVNSTVGSGTLSGTKGGPPPKGTAATPDFSVAGGTYSSAQTVALTDTTAGAAIYYTTNGQTPTTSSTLYSGPISVSVSETLEAIAVASGLNNSAVASSAYVISSTTGGSLVFSLSGFNGSSVAMNGSAAIQSGALMLTDGQGGEAGTAWYPTPVKVNGFTTSFDFQLPASDADGFTFTVQNANKGVYALGGNSSGLGYQFIDASLAVAFNLYVPGQTDSQSIGVYTGGQSPQGSAISLAGTGVNLHSGDLFHATIAYKGSSVTVTLLDKKTGAFTTQTFKANVPSSVGGATAYVGFTGSTGGSTAIQNILNWSYSN